MVSDDGHLKTYRALDLRIEQIDGVEARCKCPFCEKGKLYVNDITGMFDCKTCGLSGNKYTFMKYYYELHLNNTTRKDYNTLSKDRSGIPYEAFEEAKLAYNKDNKEWIIPVRSDEGAITNLRLWSKTSNILKNLSGCRVSIYGEDVIRNYNSIIICEGEWDAICLRWLIGFQGISGVGVVAVPGATTFKEVWSPLFHGKDVALMYDNDKAGREGSARAVRILRKHSKPKSLKVLQWAEGFADRYDVRDYISANIKNLTTVVNSLFSMLEEPKAEEERKEYFSRRTFASVIEDYEKIICMNDDISNGILLLFSIIFSNKMAGVPLWLFIVGPSGGGKTMILQSAAGSEEAYFLSNMSSKTLVSGFDVKGSDPSLLPRIVGKTLILKEFTEVLNLPTQEQEQIFDQLRGAYDGRVDRIYGNGVVRVYPVPGSGHDTCHFSFAAGVTNVIHGRNRAALGERFLRYQMFEKHQDSREIIQAAVSSAIGNVEPETLLQKSAKAFIDHKLENFYIPKVPQWVQDKIISLSQIVGTIRAYVERNPGTKDLVYRPAPEIGSRLAKQLIKIAQMVAFTLNKEEVDLEAYELTKRVALDTCLGWNRYVIMSIAKAEDGLTKAEVVQMANISTPRAETCLEDLQELGALEWTRDKEGSMGAPARRYRLTPRMKNLFEEAGLLPGKLVDSSLEIPEEYRMDEDERPKATAKIAKSPVFS